MSASGAPPNAAELIQFARYARAAGRAMTWINLFGGEEFATITFDQRVDSHV
jgi:hypothetical protein